MRSLFACILALALAAGTTLVHAQQKPADSAVSIAGKWAMSIQMEVGTGTPALALVQDGEKITGTYAGRYGEYALKGTLKGRTLQFGFTMSAEGTDVEMAFTGEVAPDAQAMSGTATMGPAGEATWTAKRAK
jgi:hypothetical protein